MQHNYMIMHMAKIGNQGQNPDNNSNEYHLNSTSRSNTVATVSRSKVTVSRVSETVSKSKRTVSKR